MNAHHHVGTPALSVIDPRTLAVRSVGYCRHPDSPVIDPRITRQRFDAAGHLIESWDPRLWGTAPKPNLTTVYGLSGQPLLTDSVDAGWQLSLLDQAGSPSSFWDARGSQRHTEFDEQQRPITVTEQAARELPRVVERLTYGGSDSEFAEHNQCGQLIRHDDPGGAQIFPAYGLGGAVLVEDRRFLAELETPDWPLDIEERETWLEAQSFITRHTYNPGGALQRQIDAMGNVRTFGYDVAGKLSAAWLQMADSGKPPQRLVGDIRYNAQDQVERETAGNGVLTHAEYAADDGRLTRLTAAAGSQNPLQDLNYVYDPVGNIVELHDRSQPVTHFDNQRIDPINRYRYDSLYQLIEAQGWEVSQPSHGPMLPELLPTPLDPNQRRNYTQRFEYDRGGNLLTRQHSGAPGFSMFTSALSNRSLAQRDVGSPPGEGEIALGFDACGNQRELQRGQVMAWDTRNQLSQVTLVKRHTEPDDYECYRYDRPGHRLRKVGFAQSSGRTLRTEVRYLPGLEIHRQADGEEHHVISGEAGRSTVRTLHWPQGEHSDQLRYSLSDHLGSSTLELDDNAGVLTQEHYYPFGGTACWAGKSVLVAKYKTIRYSGKERDATGLYYYGYRYYAPWLQRWITPDPARNIDGLNLFVMVKNNPIRFFDKQGKVGRDFNYNEYLREFKGLLNENMNVMFFTHDRYSKKSEEDREEEGKLYLWAINDIHDISPDDQRVYFHSLLNKITDRIPSDFSHGYADPYIRVPFKRLHGVLRAAKRLDPFNDDAGNEFMSGTQYTRWPNDQFEEGFSFEEMHSSSAKTTIGNAGPPPITPDYNAARSSLPDGTDERVINGYATVLDIIQHKDEWGSSIFSESRDNNVYKQTMLLIHPDKFNSVGHQPLNENALEAARIVTEWRRRGTE